jgi:hypothetical protein
LSFALKLQETAVVTTSKRNLPQHQRALHAQVVGKGISDFSRHLLKDLCGEAMVPTAIVTSVERSVEDQARIFYAKHVLEGKAARYRNPEVGTIVAHARELQAAGKGDDFVKAYLIDSIEHVHGGPKSISRHLGVQPFLEVFDVAHYSGPTSGSHRVNHMTAHQAEAFLAACRRRMPDTIARLGHSAELGLKVKGEFVDEKCFHMEVRHPIFDRLEQSAQAMVA